MGGVNDEAKHMDDDASHEAENPMLHTHRDLEILEHYKGFVAFGRMLITEFDTVPMGAPRPIYVIEFAPPSEAHDWVYATVGVSRLPMPYPKDWVGERVEHR